jgi:prophage regulatory protein
MEKQLQKSFIRQKELIPHVVPFSPATLWRKVRSGDFPKPIKLSENITAWRWDEVQAWIEAQS